MGYFNIFYKITRIIDFLTRKRNQKFIIGLCLVGAIVFFSPNISNADFNSGDSYNLTQIYNKVNNIEFDVDYYGTYLLNISQNTSWTSSISQNTTVIKNDLETAITDLQICESYLLQIMQDISHVDDDLHDLLDKIDELNTKAEDLLTACNTIIYDIEYYGELNHADLTEIQEMLKEYLYGDRQDYPITNYFVYGLLGNPTGEIFTNSGNYNTFYFKVKAGYTYHVSWDLSILSENNRRPRHGFCNVVPKDGVPLTDLTFITEDIREMDVYAEEDTIFWISYDKTRNIAFKVMSDYNEGQDLGIYGGLTIIDQQTQYQGEETRETIQEESQATRDTITSTDYNQSDVNVNTSAIDSVSTTETQGLFTTIFNNFNSAITGGVDSITVPLPHGGQLVLYSNVVSSHLGNLSSLVSAFWYFVFGLYAFKFVNNIIRNIKSGDILNGFSNNNEVITSDML